MSRISYLGYLMKSRGSMDLIGVVNFDLFSITMKTDAEAGKIRRNDIEALFL